MTLPAPQPSIGDIIHYVLREGRHAGEVRPAIVTNVFPHAENGICNGTVFIDELNDEGAERFFGSARYDDLLVGGSSATGGEARYVRGTWHCATGKTMSDKGCPPASPSLASVTGEIGFDAYGGAGPNPWKTYNGGDMPRWPSLAETPAGLVTRERWAVAAKAEIVAFLASHGLEVIPADVFANTPERVVVIATHKGPAITTTGNRA